MAASLAASTLRLLDDLPPYERDAYEIQGTLDAIAREIDRIDAAKEHLRAQFVPQTADDLLDIFEALFKLSTNPPDKDLEARRNSVLAFANRLKADNSKAQWVTNLTQLIGTGWSYQEHDPFDVSSPAANTIVVRLPYSTSLAAPALPSLVNSGVGTLAAGTYWYVVTATNIYGETTSSGAASITIPVNRAVTIDWPDVTGATGYNVYRGPSATQLSRIATVAVSTYVDSGGQTPTVPPPATNTTQSFQAFEAANYARTITDPHIQLNFTYSAGFMLAISRLGDAL